MKKRWISLCLMLTLLLGLTGCDHTLPTVEDTFSRAIVPGNTRAAEQGGYIAMRGEKNGEPALILYNKKNRHVDVLVETEAYLIGMAGNRVFYKTNDSDKLYGYNLETQEIKNLDNEVYSYQVWNNTIYLINGEHGKYYYTVDLETMAKHKVSTAYTVNRLYVTDYGVYYYDDGEDLLMVQTHDGKAERMVYHGEGETMRGVLSIGGANVMMLIQNDESGSSTLVSYNAAQNITTRHLSGSFSHFNYTGGYAVVIGGDNTVYAVDPVNEQNYTVCTVDDYESAQIMSDCIILYNGNQATIRYFGLEKE